jgi:hypothetical protein
MDRLWGCIAHLRSTLTQTLHNSFTSKEAIDPIVGQVLWRHDGIVNVYEGFRVL